MTPHSLIDHYNAPGYRLIFRQQSKSSMEETGTNTGKKHDWHQRETTAIRKTV
jgi:hypothetical protein